jgi:hypothetical protein
MSFTQLEPPIPMSVLDKGNGYAFAVIDYGQEFDLLWVIAMDDTGEIWCAPNPKVRMQGNWSMGRKKPKLPDADAPVPSRKFAAVGN